MQSKYYPIYEYINNRKVSVIDDNERYTELRMLQDFIIQLEKDEVELIETKPCKLIDVSPENIKKELLEDVRRCKKTKPEEKGISPERFFEIIDEVHREIPEEKPDHDKAMEIPDLMEDDTLEMIREREDYDKSIMEEIAEVKLYHEYKNDDWEYAITDAVNLLIKAHNNK